MSAAPPAPGESWTVLRMVLWSAEYLGGRGIERARLDAEHLLAFALNTNRLQLYLDFDRPLEPEELAAYRPLLLRRAAREPLQYIEGRAAFRDLDLYVDRRVLIPRPETEGLVQRVLEWRGAQRTRHSAWDVGTGSGAIAISLVGEGSFERVVASDRSQSSLEVARVNGERAGVVVDWREGDLFAVLRPGERFDVVVSNPPYIAAAEGAELSPEVAEWEPPGALLAGAHGLDVLRPLVAGAADVLEEGGLLAVEIGAGQAAQVLEIARSAGGLGNARVERDLSGRDRYLLAERIS